MSAGTGLPTSEEHLLLAADISAMLGEGVVTQRALDRLAYAHDASHYLLVPQTVVTPRSTEQVGEVMRACDRAGVPFTFRSRGTSLSGQGITDSVLVDTRERFQGVEVLDEGRRVRVEPGVTVRRVNAHLAPYRRKLGPDPASESACTIGGVVANNEDDRLLVAARVEQLGEPTAELTVLDAVDFVAARMLGRLTVSERVRSIALHPTCSSTELGSTLGMETIARFICRDVYVPVSWGCCAFAGDRGLHHPELTAAATAPEAAELGARDFAAYASANRTCEIAMTRATGKPYRHILELLEEATR